MQKAKPKQAINLMKITIENTDKIIELVPPHGGMPMQARIWEGETDTGVKVIVYVTRICIQDKEATKQFERELRRTRIPAAVVQQFPLKVI
jgi:hypothetical protein